MGFIVRSFTAVVHSCQIISDLVDEDAYLRKREQSVAASVIGAVHFLPKFSQSLAPMFGYCGMSLRSPLFAVVFLFVHRLCPLTRGVLSVVVMPPSVKMFPTVLLGGGGLAAVPLAAQLRSQLWTVLMWLPAVCVAVQTWLWRVCFSLRGDYLKTIKLHVSGSSGSD